MMGAIFDCHTCRFDRTVGEPPIRGWVRNMRSPSTGPYGWQSSGRWEGRYTPQGRFARRAATSSLIRREASFSLAQPYQCM